MAGSLGQDAYIEKHQLTRFSAETVLFLEKLSESKKKQTVLLEMLKSVVQCPQNNKHQVSGIK